MNSITFKQVLPHVFSDGQELNSDVWQREFTLSRGHLYLVEAGSGRGKSTFCSYIQGYRHDYTGEISFDNRNIAGLSIAEWVDMRRRHVSLLFQELRLFPELTAYENVAIKNQLTNHKTREEIEAWFVQLGIGDKLSSPVGLLSYGQQQRVALIRALAQPFDFLLADEPISHLDERNAQVMADVMMSEAKSQGAAVIVTSIGRHMSLNYEKVFKL